MSQGQGFDSFESALKFGEEGEKLVAEILINKNVVVSPLYQFETKYGAPFAIGNFGKVNLPDLSCWAKGESFFVECKRKNQWVNNYRGLETGLDQRHYKEYKTIKNKTGQKVFIFFIHEKDKPGVFYNELDQLDSNARYWCGTVNGKRYSPPLVFFERSKLIKIKDVTNEGSN
jgi:hypothetical protein